MAWSAAYDYGFDMGQRFFVETSIGGNTATLAGQEALHVAKVMRARIGDEITLFDGSGDEFTARIANIGRSEIKLEIVDRRTVSRELTFSLTLGVALPKGDRQKRLVEKLTELGVTRLVPLIAQRGVAQPEPKTIVRLRRSVIEASKQCGRNHLMEISEPLPCSNFLNESPPSALRVLAHPGSDTASPIPRREQRDVILAIGPEGGFTDDEVSQSGKEGWQRVNLGSRMLRVETAALALAAAYSLG